MGFDSKSCAPQGHWKHCVNLSFSPDAEWRAFVLKREQGARGGWIDGWVWGGQMEGKVDWSQEERCNGAKRNGVPLSDTVKTIKASLRRETCFSPTWDTPLLMGRYESMIHSCFLISCQQIIITFIEFTSSGLVSLIALFLFLIYFQSFNTSRARRYHVRAYAASVGQHLFLDVCVTEWTWHIQYDCVCAHIFQSPYGWWVGVDRDVQMCGPCRILKHSSSPQEPDSGSSGRLTWNRAIQWSWSIMA